LNEDEGEEGMFRLDNLYAGSSGEDMGVSESSDMPPIPSFPRDGYTQERLVPLFPLLLFPVIVRTEGLERGESIIGFDI
jgi:hypothetical protein